MMSELLLVWLEQVRTDLGQSPGSSCLNLIEHWWIGGDHIDSTSVHWYSSLFRSWSKTWGWGVVARCDVIIILGSSVGIWRIQQIILKDYHSRKVFIIPSFIVWENAHNDYVTCSLQITLHRRNIPGLKDYLLAVGPYTYPGVLTHNVWYDYFLCCIIHSMFAACRPCDETNHLHNVDPSVYDVNNFRFTFSVYSAVYAVASALHNFFLSKCHGHFKSCISNQFLHLGEVNRYLKNVHFTTPGGESIYFDHEGNSPPRFDLINTFVVNQTKEIKQVGQFLDNDQQSLINDSEIHWDSKFSQV
ncbi:hypothetical protein PRIEUP_LOCUS1528, partial [Pristimantis euphronides]